MSAKKQPPPPEELEQALLAPPEKPGCLSLTPMDIFNAGGGNRADEVTPSRAERKKARRRRAQRKRVKQARRRNR